MYLLCNFEKPANDNVRKDPYDIVCNAFMAACRPDSGVSRKERNRLQKLLVDMTRETTKLVNEAATDIRKALDYSRPLIPL